MTIRQQLIQILEDGPCTVRDLSQAVGIPEKEVPDHLEHIARSLAHDETGRTLVKTPCECLECGFVFEKRKRMTRPSRCPECRSERIDGPTFQIHSP